MRMLKRPLVLFTLVFAALAKADDSRPEIITEWIRATESVHSVRTKVDVVEYNGTFECQRNGKGEIGYLGPRHGFLRLVNNPDKTREPRRTKSGERFTIDPHPAEHVRWCDDYLRVIDDDSRMFSEAKMDQKQNHLVNFGELMCTLPLIGAFHFCQAYRIKTAWNNGRIR